MFWDVMNICKTAIIAVGSWTWTLFDTIGGVGCIVAFSIIGLFVSFIVLHKTDAVSLGSDIVSSSRSDKVQRARSEWSDYNSVQNEIDKGW